jgi:hypothetical protein
VIGHFSSSLRDLAGALGSPSAQYLFEGIYYVLPNLSNFSFATNAAHGILPSASIIAWSFAYALMYDAVLLFITVLIFRRRNFK